MSDDLLLARIRIDFFRDGELYGMRHSIYVPVVGDEVRFHNTVYKVVHRIWICDEKDPRVALSIEPIETAPKKPKKKMV